MRQTDVFSGFHPWVNLCYFALVLVFSMAFLHPVCLLIALGAALGYSSCLYGRRLLGGLKYLVPVVLLAAVINPLFTHRGVTVLAYFPSGNPLTMESIAYGLAASVMLAAVFLWFSCWNQVLSTDKMVYLFGRAAPALSLLLSMVLRFIPGLARQMKKISQAQLCLRGGEAPASFWGKLKSGAGSLSILVTWSLEHAVETADAMKSRGYGLPGRTAFALYRWDRRDKGMLAWLLGCGCILVIGWVRGDLAYGYYPRMTGAWTPVSAVLFVVYLALCLTPLVLNGREVWRWKSGKVGPRPL